ncbi:helix-turn-helix transcriptional regulator [Microvirga terricola]|uniref:YafY family transcriptional regulator n=1 Tax=Microvirga terricola TaxID=2719797 RepID=A0ABX0VF47_9HYPH|nr:YafY family protein [Microvirga terricola]NIX76966.1 YafY family transcriptional regulator [Microvirga terricola]
MSRSARLLDLIQVLRRRRRPITASEIAEELGISLRTVYRDIATLMAQGMPIEGEAGLGYVLKPGFFLPPLMLGENEMDAIILGLRFVSQRGDKALAVAAEDALAKITAVLPPGLEDAAATSGLLAGPGSTSDASRLAALRRAIRAEEKLRLSYVDKLGVATERVVWPVAIGFFDAVEMLAAWCETRSDFRHFRLDRIASAASTGERMPKRQRILLAEWRLVEGLGDLI